MAFIDELLKFQQMPQGQGPLLAQMPPQVPQPPIAPSQIAMPLKAPLAAPGTPVPSYERQFDDAYLESMGLRKDQLEELKQKLSAGETNKLTGMAALNLKPFAAFTDQLTGQHTAHNYGEPAAVQRSREDLEKLQAAVERGSNSVADDQLNYLKLKANEQLQKNMMAKADRTQSRSELSNEFKLRNEWDGDPITKNTKGIAEGFGKIESAYLSNDPADYMTMIYGLMKMQDPASSVKEGEFKTGEGIGGWPEKWQTMFQKATGDVRGGITQNQKESIMHQARQIYEAQLQRQAQVNASYTDMATRYGMNPSNVVLDSVLKPMKNDKAPATQGAPPALAVGTVKKNHVYLGGDPSKPSSWRKQ